MKRKILFDLYKEDVKAHSIYFMLSGDKGIVEFDLLTKWIPTSKWQQSNAAKRGRIFTISDDELYLLEIYMNPLPADVCRWSLERLSEDDTEMNGISRVYDGQTVFYGYTYDPHPRDVFDALVSDGEEKVWEMLEDYYIREFGGN